MMFGGAIGAVILVVIALSVIEVISGEDDEGDDAFPAVQAAEANYDDFQSEPYFLGDPDAPVHLVEWSDYQ